MLNKFLLLKRGGLLERGGLIEDSRYNAKASAKSPVTKIRRHCASLNTMSDL